MDKPSKSEDPIGKEADPKRASQPTTPFAYLQDWIYGGIDGAVTTFAIVTGGTGAEVSHGVVLVLGIANLLADGFSMAAGNYAATQSALEQTEYLRVTQLDPGGGESVGPQPAPVQPEGERSPWTAALSTMGSFILCGSVPLAPFVLNVAQPFLVASVLTGMVFFGIGAARSQWSMSPWWRTGLATLIIGGLAAGLSYSIGLALRGFAL